MRALRIIVLAVLVLALCLFGYTLIANRMDDDSNKPVISSTLDYITVSRNYTDKDLLEGLIAHDEKDGDITSSLTVQSVSKFIEKGTVEVTYAVANSKNEVTFLKRNAVFSDYKSPRFEIISPLSIPENNNRSIFNLIKAEDEIDGNISSKMRIISSDIDAKKEGFYTVEIGVENSVGDFVVLPFIVEVNHPRDNAPVVKLSKYIVYTNVGEKIDPYYFIERIYDPEKEEFFDRSDVVIETEGTTDEEGVMHIYYSVTNDYGVTSKAVLMVVVEK